jgi:hypothetical protein
MFRDFKTGGYNNVKGQRLTSLWTMSWSNCSQMVEELIKLNRNKFQFYQRGLRAIRLIQSRL